MHHLPSLSARLSALRLDSIVKPCLLPLKLEEMIDHLSAVRHVEGPGSYDVNWGETLGKCSFGVVHPANVRSTQREVAVKAMDWTSRPDAVRELRRCVALSGHSDFLQVLDVGYFGKNPRLDGGGLDQPRVSLSWTPPSKC